MEWVRRFNIIKLPLLFKLIHRFILLHLKLTRCLFWHVGPEEWIVELGKLILKCIRAEIENKLRMCGL